ncbi:hypothetical protein DB346_22775 [Verrucomicrobia bacterium LW23]|nr:hypothetical protein DB346_22775 [Verrucomicrobia bacterium LW23]
MKSIWLPKYSRVQTVAFTLIEVMVGCAVSAVLILILSQVVNVAGNSWVDSQKKVEASQNGRALLGMISRELSSAVIGPSWQFVQNPTFPSDLDTALAPETDSLFWQSRTDATAKGDVQVIGYYVVRDDARRLFQLRRLYLTPTDGRYPATFNPSGKTRTSASAAPWVAALGNSAFDISISGANTSVVADGIIGFWVRCLDAAGHPIPWWHASVAASGSDKIKYNSAATFQAGRYSTDPSDSAFTYLRDTGSMPRGDALPTYIEVTAVIVDYATLRGRLPIPQPPSLNTPDELPAKLEEFQQSLIAGGIKSARVFSTRLKLTK